TTAVTSVDNHSTTVTSATEPTTTVTSVDNHTTTATSSTEPTAPVTSADSESDPVASDEGQSPLSTDVTQVSETASDNQSP
ncbi:MAG: hypothetical protein IIY89_00410, partial [Clostridia bacterium]|nr:hypothetical protein [Clostridia bacterium]